MLKKSDVKLEKHHHQNSSCTEWYTFSRVLCVKVDLSISLSLCPEAGFLFYHEFQESRYYLSANHSRLHFLIMCEGLTINGLLPKYIPMHNYFEDDS